MPQADVTLNLLRSSCRQSRLSAYACLNGNADKIEKEGRDVKQKTKLKELDIRTKHILDILQTEGVVDAQVPSKGIVETPN